MRLSGGLVCLLTAGLTGAMSTSTRAEDADVTGTFGGSRAAEWEKPEFRKPITEAVREATEPADPKTTEHRDPCPTCGMG